MPMKLTLHLYYILVFVLICPLIVKSQQPDTLLQQFHDQYTQEKIHIHFDKSVYNKGDTIWMKLYLMDGNGFTECSKSIYVDYYGTDGNLLSHLSAPVRLSSAKLQFAIPKNYTGTSVHAIAYTRWMLNFDKDFLYNQEIPIAQNASDVTKSAASKTILHFFPEGGQLVTGIPSLVAFMAYNQSGTPVNIFGSIKTSNGKFLDSFTTAHDGMGSFSFQPEKSEHYIVEWTDGRNGWQQSSIPEAEPSGATLEIHPLKGRALFEIKRTEDAPDNFKEMYLIAASNQQMLYQSKINLTTKTSLLSQIPTSTFPSGILTLTLFDKNWVPVAERIIFVNNHEYEFHPSIQVKEQSLERHGKNTVEISMPDTLFSNLSVAITDGDLIYDQQHTILSQFLISSELKGYIHNPGSYLSGDADSLSDFLDLVMLTHGWRKYPWEKILSGQLPALAFPKEKSFIRINGSLYAKSVSNKSAAHPILNLILTGRDSSRQITSLLLDGDSAFSYDKGIFYDSLQIRYQFNKNDKLTERGEMRFDNGLINTGLKVSIGFLQKPEALNLLYENEGQQKIRMMLEEQAKLEKLRAQITLNEVVVKTKTKTQVQLMDEKYTSGLFSGEGYKFDVVNDVFAQNAPDILTYLQGKVPGLLYSHKSSGAPILTWRTNNTEVYINEVLQIGLNNVLNLDVHSIAYVKAISPIFFGSAGSGTGGAVAIYLRDGTETDLLSNKYTLPTAMLAGYSPYKAFYVPDYSQPTSNIEPDFRSTLYWNPFVLTDAAHQKVQLSFFNNDTSKKLRVVIEGFNIDGKLTHIEKLIE